ncbi:MAG: DNA polymerase III subunit delta, partial [Chloroflexi bacterium CFX2]|nr:DNA polymerase III subunit delta [Chloroflexi bacterium CFX2]
MPTIYLLYGNDEFAIARKVKEFESDFTDPTAAEMNTTRLEARTMTENDLNNAVNAMPFLAPKRLVFIAYPSARYNKPDGRKKFLEFLEKAPDTTKVILFDTVEKPKDSDKHWLVKWAEKNKAFVKSQPFFLPQLRDMPGWIVNETKNQGGKIEPGAAAKLAEMTGVDTRQAGMEISKLLAYVNWERPVRGSDVEAVCIVTSQQSVFDFVDALSQGNARVAQKLL